MKQKKKETVVIDKRVLEFILTEHRAENRRKFEAQVAEALDQVRRSQQHRFAKQRKIIESHEIIDD